MPVDLAPLAGSSEAGVRKDVLAVLAMPELSAADAVVEAGLIKRVIFF